MRKDGFTLIELIMVILILGILGVVAAPKYFDLQVEARRAAADGVFGAAASACSVNYTAVQTKETPPSPIETCNLLNDSIVSSGITIAPGASTSNECFFSVDDNDFFFSLTEETSESPCAVTKVSGKWPAS